MYTRKKLIEICEKAIVPHEKWRDRDSSDAQLQVGQCAALLKAGCGFKILEDGDLQTNEKTIWIEITFTDFTGFEMGESNNKSETFYLPTLKRLRAAKGGDWY